MQPKVVAEIGRPLAKVVGRDALLEETPTQVRGLVGTRMEAKIRTIAYRRQGAGHGPAVEANTVATTANSA